MNPSLLDYWLTPERIALALNGRSSR